MSTSDPRGNRPSAKAALSSWLISQGLVRLDATTHRLLEVGGEA